MHCKTRENWPFSGLFFDFRVIFTSGGYLLKIASKGSQGTFVRQLEKAVAVTFTKHPARKVWTRSRAGRPKVHGRFAFPSALPENLRKKRSGAGKSHPWTNTSQDRNFQRTFRTIGPYDFPQEKVWTNDWSIWISPGKGMDQWPSKFSESFGLDRYWSIECPSLRCCSP